ncbi:MAG TPA: pyrroloquinoline quinone biosynthesis peptide chaperone PqqD [Rhodospirillales bacterium]|jgi:pyrroloquinoline quinone biosynthesis protein D|nr:pyrroloquinoline quinone biosynthesis peptide chaperone PqqD [Rhodospirillales bacterium]
MTIDTSCRSALSEAGVPRFAPHVRLSFDRRRGRWVVMAPERLFVPDEIAAEILRRCDGAASIAAIIDALAAEFDAPREEIAADVLALVSDLCEQGVLMP